jgi:hypothetical protein
MPRCFMVLDSRGSGGSRGNCRTWGFEMRVYGGGLGQDLMNQIVGAQSGDTTDLANDPSYALQSQSSASGAAPLTGANATFLTTGTLPANVGSSSGTSTLLYVGLAVFGILAFMGMSKR